MMSSTPRHGGQALPLTTALLASALAAATAQAPNDDYMSGQQVHVSTAMIALLAAVIAVFLFIACATIYLRHCTGGYAVGSGFDGRAVALDRTTFVSRRQRRPRGLDADVVSTFPTMKYAEAKALRVGTNKGGGASAALECAVCLSEFEDEERLMLLPKCSHAFHLDCIGQWLAGHVTCPVCRCNLDPNHKDSTSSDEQPASFPFPAAVQSNSVSIEEVTSSRHDDGVVPVAVVIDVVTEEDEEERRLEAMELEQIGSQRRRAMRSRSGQRRPVPATQLARAHSTGHSLAVRLDRDLERFTLRLPEHVRREMVAASEHSLQSLRGRRAGGGEGSSRGGRSGPLTGRAARWQSLLVRTFSGTASFFSASRATVSSEGGEVSSTSSSRVRGKRVAAVDVHGKGGILRLDRIGGSSSGAKAGTVPHEAAPEVDEEKAVTQQVRTS